MTWPGIVLLLCAVAYGLGVRDGLKGRPPEPLKGNFAGCEDKEDQDKEYPDDWV